MDILKSHEIFEIEALEALKNNRLLESLVFGGGTMLRLCHELDRYSADLDFWFIRDVDPEPFLDSLCDSLEREYEVTDAVVKHFTILCEIRTNRHPRRLKIEIRRKKKSCDSQDRIAFSRFSTKQVILKVHTLEQSMKNKVQAALDRKEIRDCFDIEFLLRRGIPLYGTKGALPALRDVIRAFGEKDYKVTLGSTLETETRRYYTENNFSLLLEHIASRELSSPD